MELLTSIVTVVVLGFVGIRLVTGLRHSASGPGRALVVEIVRGIRWRHLWPVPFVLTAVVVAASVAVTVPGLAWGWWTAIGGEGNPVTGGTAQTVGTVWEWVVPMVFMALLIPALPLFAHAEERLFRTGAEQWSAGRRALKCVQFGLVHALVGIPIGVALALSLGGAYFMRTYLRDYRSSANRRSATLESARAHTAYNASIVVLVIVSAVLTGVGAW